ncbi:MAG: hypothetical protein ACM3RX_00880 [Methanococcaceae archaeon]
MKFNFTRPFFFLFFFGLAQIASAQFYDATLELSSGKILQGGAKPTFRSFVFKEDGNSKELIFKPEEVRQLTIHDKRYPADTLKYRFERKKEGKEPWLLTIFIDGRVSLYARISKAQPGYDIYYLLKKQGDEVVRDITFKSSAGDLLFPELKSLTDEDLKYFFGDYPGLMINGKLNEKFRKKDLGEFMAEYNRMKSR